MAAGAEVVEMTDLLMRDFTGARAFPEFRGSHAGERPEISLSPQRFALAPNGQQTAHNERAQQPVAIVDREQLERPPFVNVLRHVRRSEEAYPDKATDNRAPPEAVSAPTRR